MNPADDLASARSVTCEFVSSGRNPFNAINHPSAAKIQKQTTAQLRRLQIGEDLSNGYFGQLGQGLYLNNNRALNYQIEPLSLENLAFVDNVDFNLSSTDNSPQAQFHN